MRNLSFSAFLVLLCLLAGCNRDPNVAKKRYVENGNKYFSNGKYKEALIMYRNALKRDMKYGEAYYRAALAEMAMQRFVDASRDLQRAVELMPDNIDAQDRLSNLYLNVYIADKKRPKQLFDELKGLADKYARRFPNSYSEARLRGYLALFEGDKDNALKYFEKANSLKPYQQDLVMVYMQTLAGSGKPAEAEKLGNEMLQKNPAALPVYDVMYLLYGNQKRFDDAEKVLRTKLEKNPKVPEIRLQLAAHYYGMKDREKMMQTLQSLEADQANYPNAPLMVGDFFARIRDYDQAIQRYQDGAKKYPKDKAMYQKRMVEILVKKNQKDEAAQLVNEILKDDPKDNEAIAMRASLSLLAGSREQLQSAINDLQTVVSKMPENPVLRYNLGRALLAKQNVDAAKVQFEEAIKLRPDYLLPRITLAQMSLQKGDNAKVIQMSQEILALDPNNLAARLLRSRALIGMGEMKQARQELQLTSAKYPEIPEAKLQVAALDLQDKNFKSAEESFRKIYNDYKDPRAFMGLVDGYVLQGNTATALKMLREELAKNPERLEYRLAIANISGNGGDYKTAVSEYKAVLDKLPRNSQVWLQLSEVYRRAGEVDNAVAAVKKAQELAPTNAAAHLQMAMLYETTGKRPEAKPMYEQVLRLQPDNPVALNNLAFILAESGNDLDTALTMAQKAKQLKPQDEDVADTLGWIYIKKNIPDSAVSIFRELTAKNPNRATFHYHLAMALYQKGDKTSAKRECEMALRNNDNASEVARVRELLAKLG